MKDQLHGADYVREEDPRIFHSQKTGRGPLKETWIEDFWNECKVIIIIIAFLRFLLKLVLEPGVLTEMLIHDFSWKKYSLALFCLLISK